MPADRLDSMRAWNDDELRQHMVAVMRMIVSVANAIAAARRDPHTTRRFVDTLDLRLISRDHEWRSVFARLKHLGRPDAHHHALALRKYLQYLRSRKQAIDAVRAVRRDLADTDEIVESTWQVESGEVEFLRVPLGETIEVRLNYRGNLHLRLGGHVFVLRDGYPPALVDPEGRSLTLRRGRQCVGRHPDSDVVIRSQFGQVSRAHMLVEWPGEDLLYVTDLSSLGTFIEYQPPQ